MVGFDRLRSGGRVREIRISTDSQNTVMREYIGGDTRTLIKEKTGDDIDIQNLSRQDFFYVGSWRTVGIGPDKGFFYTLGIKAGYKDEEGDPVELHFHFVAPFAPGGMQLASEELRRVIEGMQTVLAFITQAYSAAHPKTNVRALASFPPEVPKFLMNDLEKLVS